MRTVKRNTRSLYYQNFVSSTYEVDGSGNKTGRQTKTYGTKTAFRANMVFGTGTGAAFTQYGMENNYSITIYMANNSLNLAEGTLLYVKKTDAADFIVTSVINNLNNVVVIAKEIR